MVRLQNNSRLQWLVLSIYNMLPAGGAPCLVPALATCTLLLVMGELSSAAVVTHTYTRVHNNVSIMLYTLCSETLASHCRQ